MDEKTECRSLYFLVSILWGIICIVFVVITHTRIILASRWRFRLLLVFYQFPFFKHLVDNEQDAAEPGDDEEIVSESESECDFTSNFYHITSL
jgi:hypothetical protein